jgi:hypothetical protein
MAKNRQIGSNPVIVPEAGDNPGWGEDTTELFDQIIDALADVQGPNDILTTSANLANALADVQGPNDILTTSANLANNQTGFPTPASVPGLVFNTGQVQSIDIDYLVIRVYDLGATTITESGKMYGNYDGSTFFLSVESTGNVGISFDITNAGQVTYTTDDRPDHESTTIRFKAKTIDKP